MESVIKTHLQPRSSSGALPNMVMFPEFFSADRQKQVRHLYCTGDVSLESIQRVGANGLQTDGPAGFVLPRGAVACLRPASPVLRLVWGLHNKSLISTNK